MEVTAYKNNPLNPQSMANLVPLDMNIVRASKESFNTQVPHIDSIEGGRKKQQVAQSLAA